MRSRVAAAFVFAFALACDRPAPAPAKPVPPPQKTENIMSGEGEKDIDADNLLNLAYGASVVSRTGESNLELSALHAVDGLRNTFWSSPPGDARQTLVFALAARSRIDHLGVSAAKDTCPKEVRFEASAHGKRWQEVLVQKPDPVNDPQIVEVKPFEARYLRITVTEPRAYFATLTSVHALGRELEPAAPRDFNGCWTINGRSASLGQDGARVTGVIPTDPPTYLEGGSDGRVARVMWLRSPNRGYATISLDPETRMLSGLVMYDDIFTNNVVDAWFGKPCAANTTTLSAPTVGTKELSELLQRVGRWSLYGLAFDAREQLSEGPSRATLDVLVTFLRVNGTQHHFRLVSHELSGVDAPHKRTEARIASLRAALAKRGVDVSKIEFVAEGSKWSTVPLIVAVQRLLASRIDLEIAATPK